MPPVADIAAPDRSRRPGLVWFITPLLLVAIWLTAVLHRVEGSHHLASSGVAAKR